MKKRISGHIKKFLSCTESRSNTTNVSAGVDVREEYANAFRTESYNDFWTRVLLLSNQCSGPSGPPILKESSTAARLSSYRLFAQHLLDPDQPTVTQILSLAQIRPKNRSLLADYFTQTADASLLCGLLLKEIDNIRVKYLSLKNGPIVLTRLTEFSTFINPFVLSGKSPSRLRSIQAGCSALLKQLESSRDRARAKLRHKNRLKRGSAIFLVALTASLTLIVLTHALAPLLAATPALIATSLELASTRRLARVSAQFDAAAKGTYILNRDLDTISRLVTRLNDELEDMRARVKFWVERKQEGLRVGGEVARQLKKYDCSFSQQLDELEEHLYLCFMTINRARNLVVKEILDPGQPGKNVK